MITWQSYSHFELNIRYYYLVFLWNNVFFLIPTLICSCNWLQIYLVNGRCILGLKFITFPHSLSLIKIKQAFPFITHARVFPFAKLETNKHCLDLMLSTFQAGQFEILVSLSLTLYFHTYCLLRYSPLHCQSSQLQSYVLLQKHILYSMCVFTSICLLFWWIFSESSFR